MSLTYKFKKEQLEDGSFVSRPRIIVMLKGKNASLKVPALIDSGSDITVIPEKIANILGMDMGGEKTTLYAYHESTDAIKGKVSIIFIGKVERQSVALPDVPVLISLGKNVFEEEEDITLGINGIFDAFDITFKKSKNRIILKKIMEMNLF